MPALAFVYRLLTALVLVAAVFGVAAAAPVPARSCESHEPRPEPAPEHETLTPDARRARVMPERRFDLERAPLLRIHDLRTVRPPRAPLTAWLAPARTPPLFASLERLLI